MVASVLPVLRSLVNARRHCGGLVVALLCLAQQTARADLWAYVDAQGETHFASEQLDKRYGLFLRVPEAEPYVGVGIAPPYRPPAVPATGARRISFFNTADDYKAVMNTLRMAALAHGVELELLQALVFTESGFDAGALSPKGAVGLMQVIPATANRVGVKADATRTIAQKLVDPAVNVPTGTRYLRYLLDLFSGRLDLALAAYNAGEGAVQRAGNQIPVYKETQNYVRTVLDLYGQLKPAAGAQRSGGPDNGRAPLPDGAVGQGRLPVAAAESSAEQPFTRTNVNKEPVPNE